MTLIPLIQDRPPIVRHNGWIVYLSVKDAAYLRQRRAWRAVLRQAHPDGGGCNSVFNRAYLAYRWWKRTAQAQYAAIGQRPPDDKSQIVDAPRPPKAQPSFKSRHPTFGRPGKPSMLTTAMRATFRDGQTLAQWCAATRAYMGLTHIDWKTFKRRAYSMVWQLRQKATEA